ncbi:MAG: YceI family protein [Acidobacteria bacterium]|nr:YceI family protein [Acidobacteriota bacterium]
MGRGFAKMILLSCVVSLLFVALPVSAQRRKTKPQPQPKPPRVFTFDASASEIAVILTQEGLISRRYPTHRVLAKSFSGKIELPADETKMVVGLEADPKMLTNVDAAMGEFERKEFHAALRTQVLESEKFPTIKFASVSVNNVQRDGDKRSFTLNGDLTVHGVTQRVSFPVNATISDNELRATGEEKLKQSDFGLKPFEKGLGLIKIGDELKVTFNVVAKMQ